MPLPAVRIVLTRDNFRELVAGGELRFTLADPLPMTVLVDLDLDRAGMEKWSDPPEAREFLKKPRIGIKARGC